MSGIKAFVLSIEGLKLWETTEFYKSPGTALSEVSVAILYPNPLLVKLSIIGYHN